jgi:hypothetical protein
MKVIAMIMGPNSKKVKLHPLMGMENKSPAEYLALFEKLYLSLHKDDDTKTNTVIEILSLLENKEATRAALLHSNALLLIAVIAKRKYRSILIKILQTFSLEELDEIVEQNSFPASYTAATGFPVSLVDLFFNSTSEEVSGLLEIMFNCYPAQRERILEELPLYCVLSLLEWATYKGMNNFSILKLLGTNTTLRDVLVKTIETNYSSEASFAKHTTSHRVHELIRCAAILSTIAFYFGNPELIVYLLKNPQIKDIFNSLIEDPLYVKLSIFLIRGIAKLPPEETELAIDYILEKINLWKVVAKILTSAQRDKENTQMRMLSDSIIFALLHLLKNDNASGKLKNYIKEKVPCLSSLGDQFSQDDLLILNSCWDSGSLASIDPTKLKVNPLYLRTRQLIGRGALSVEANQRGLAILRFLYVNEKMDYPCNVTLLHCANVIGDVDFVKKMIDEKNPSENINSQTIGKGNTPLHYLLESDTLNFKILVLLLGAGPNLDIRNKNGISVRDMMQDKTGPHYKMIRQAVYLQYQWSVIALNEQTQLPLEVRTQILSYCFPSRTDPQLIDAQNKLSIAWHNRSHEKVQENGITETEMTDVGEGKKRKEFPR